MRGKMKIKVQFFSRAAAEAWLNDLVALAECEDEVAAIMGVADKILKSRTTKQTTLHSFFQ